MTVATIQTELDERVAAQADRHSAHRVQLGSPEQTRRMLWLERMRAERAGTTMLVAVIEFQNPLFAESQHDVEEVLSAHLGRADQAGLLDSRGLAIVSCPAAENDGLAAVRWMAASLDARGIAIQKIDAFVSIELINASWECDTAVRGASSIGLHPLESLFARRRPFWKWSFDHLGAVVGVVLLAPLMLATAVIIKSTSRGPILFRQRRTGRGNRPFEVYKFRTMVVGAEQRQHLFQHLNEQDGPAFKIIRDPRLTLAGGILRRLCIDELPQLFNVLQGHMSLVGPRPLPCRESDACSAWQRRRLEVLPGLTCIWQSRGRDLVSFAEWMRMDLDYCRRVNLLADLRILLATVRVVTCWPRFGLKAGRTDARD